MHKVWEAESATTRFWKRLIRERAVEFMRSPDYLRALRHRNDQAREDQKRFGHIWEEFGTNVYKLIAGAHGESWDKWDEEDEQKEMQRVATAPNKPPPLHQRQNDGRHLVAAREASTRGGEHLLQGEPEESLSLLEEEQSSEKSGESGTQETEEKEEEDEEEERANTSSFFLFSSLFSF